MFGPHLWHDLVRLARKGWPTWLRVLYLGVLLISLTVLHQSQGNTARSLAQHAERSFNYALTVVIVQDLLVLLVLPVYVASAIVEEKENRTIESLFLTHLSDREIVLGKLGARLIPVAALVLAGLPLLAFLRLAGNIDIDFLLYHEMNTLMLLVVGGCICIWQSTQSESAFQAITGSYPYLLPLAFAGIIVVSVLPWMVGGIVAHVAQSITRAAVQPVPWYAGTMLLCLPVYLATALLLLQTAIGNMRQFRREQLNRPRRLSSALSLTDNRPPPPRQRRHKAVSHIHPLAQPVRDNALFWKECLKDGSGWSLSARWLVPAVGIVLVSAVVVRLMVYGAHQGAPANERELRAALSTFPYTAYFVSLAAYALLVTFQTTLTVAGEKEQDTLAFLLLIPDERPAILFNKWLGPLWRNWPVLAIAYLGVLLGAAGGLFSLRTTLILALFPWPLLLMLSAVALFLSVLCRRVLFANIVLIGLLASLLLLHSAAQAWLGDVVLFYVTLLFDTSLAELKQIPTQLAAQVALCEQAAFVAAAGLCGWLALRRFRTRPLAG
jgi:ABC-type transport system involved in multi-copper enzyme maturation permease subunit